ncbi:MAG: nucleotidyltransferase domain-containing protein [Promethearchaeota archaeon]
MELFVDTKLIGRRKNRPVGEIKSKNHYQDLIKGAEWMVSQLKDLTGVIGITLSGGLSRGYGDELSEIDLMIYLDKKAYEKWSQGEAPVPQGDTLWNGYYFDLEFLSYYEEWDKKWDPFMKWDASYNKILYDPYSKIVKLLEHKDIFTAREKFQCAATSFGKCVYIGNLVVQQWIKRGDPLIANHLINKAIKGLIKIVFLINDEYLPPDKWSLNYSYSLDWLPEGWRERISDVILVKEISMEEAERRCKILHRIYNECWERLVGTKFKDLEFIEINLYNELQYIISKTPVNLNEFSEKFDIKHLTFEPIFQLTEIKTKDNVKWIIFKKEKFLEQREENFKEFLDWNKNLLKKLVL